MRHGRFLAERRSRPAAAIEMAPLIDMVFILLIFFIVTTSFIREAGVEIDRPRSAQARSMTESFVPVAIHKAGSVHVAGRVIRPDDVAAITRAMAEASTWKIVIQADREVPTGLLLRVLDTCRMAGGEQVDVAAIRP